MPAQLNDELAASRLGIVGKVKVSDIVNLVPPADAVAAGSTLGLEQSLLAAAGQVGLNVLAVAYTNTGKVQGVSLGAGNVVQVYANGDDFNNGVVLYREFMAEGEPICFTGLSSGAIISSTQGFYGCSEIDHGGTFLSTCGLLSLGLAIKDSFVFAFRHAQRTTDNNGFIFFVNGPLESAVTVTYGDGSVIADQPTQTLAPWEFGSVHLDGDTEYRILSSNPVMAAILTGFDRADFNSTATPVSVGVADVRLVVPTSNDVITHPRSGNMSAPFSGTTVDWYSVANTKNSFSVSPGTPVDIQTATGISTTDYNPSGFVRFRATGLVIANSGADGAGRNATPACPVSAMSQVVAQPLFITDAGNGDQASVTIASASVGTARVYEWDDSLGQIVLAYTVPLNRQGVTVNSAEDQLHPAAGQVSNEPDSGVVTLIGDLKPGLIKADVDIMVIVQSNGTPATTIRSQGGTTTNALVNDDDETLMFGVTPSRLKAELTEGTDGLLYKRVITAGVENWVLA